jgi:hypothetical protein
MKRRARNSMRTVVFDGNPEFLVRATQDYERASCATEGCETKLSRYNSFDTCAMHTEPDYSDTGGRVKKR